MPHLLLCLKGGTFIYNDHRYFGNLGGMPKVKENKGMDTNLSIGVWSDMHCSFHLLAM